MNDPLMARLASVKLCAEALGLLCTAAAEQGPQSPAEQLTSECGITTFSFLSNLDIWGMGPAIRNVCST